MLTDVPRSGVANASSPSQPESVGFSLVRLSADDISAKPASTLLSLFNHFSQPTFPCAQQSYALHTMSFGFSVGDFLAAIQLVTKIRKEFADAPSQFKDISDEYEILLIH
jgi:hypothetical protein